MELSYKGHINGVVTAAWMAGRPVAEIYMNGEKLYPLEGDVATQILVDIALGDIEGPLNYWLHLLDFKSKYGPELAGYYEEESVFDEEQPYPFARAKMLEYQQKGYKTRIDRHGNHALLYVRRPCYYNESVLSLTIGDKVYKDLTDFTFDGNTGLITFTGKQLPELASLPLGTKLKLSATLPERDMENERFQAAQNKDTSKTFNLPLLPGTKFYFYYYKGQKKVSAGTRLTVVGVPSNTEFYYGKGQRNGHSRGAVTGIVPPGGTGWDETTWRSDDRWVEGDLQFKITIGPFNNSTPLSNPIFPTFTKEWSLKVIGVIIKQI